MSRHHPFRRTGSFGFIEAAAALRMYPDAYRAIKQNYAALKAVQNNTATPEQREVAERVTAQHGEGIRALAAVELRHPGSITAAARRMGFFK